MGKFLRILGLICLTSLLTSVLVVIGIGVFLFPGAFKPVTLYSKEQATLQKKINYLDQSSRKDYRNGQSSLEKNQTEPQDGPLTPRAYSEDGATRDLMFTEREVNALIAGNTDLGAKLAIDFSQDLASARLRLPLDDDFPVLGGKVLRASAGVGLRYEAGKPVIVLKGVSIWGMPVPNAWLGNLKNIDLVREFNGDDSFWTQFSNGIEHISVKDGKLSLTLKE